jgi:capsular polysaccharide biosynthesis protein
MEFRQYFSIIPRRWPVIAFATAVALVVAVVFALRGPRAYEATVRLAVSLGGDAAQATAAPPSFPGATVQGSSTASEVPPYVYYRDYYAWLAAEYLADDLSEVIRSDSFLADVGSFLDEDVRRVLVRDVIRTKKTHRILEVSVQAPQPEQAERIAAGINRVIQDEGGKYLAQLATPSGKIAVLDKPVARPASATGSQVLDIGIRTLAGLVIGLFLAVVAEYLDSTLRTARDAERALALPVLGQIPADSR